MFKLYLYKKRRSIQAQLCSFFMACLLLLSAVSSNAQLTYCTTHNDGGAGSLIDQVQFGGVTHNTASTPAPAPDQYAYYPAVTISVIMGTIENLTISIDPPGTYSGAIVSVWIDWNQDGTLSATEWTQVGTNIVNGSPATVPITIPATATPGLTRMRIRSRGTGNQNGSGDACLSMGSGETEDYDINVVPATACSGTPLAGNTATSSSNVCMGQNYTLSLQGATVASGLTYQWEESPVGLNSWTSIATGTNPSYTTTMSGAMEYRCIIACGSASDTSTPVTVNVSPFYNCYCSPNTGTTLHTCCGNYISNVNIVSTTLNNSSTTAGGGYYTFYPNTVASQTGNLAQGVTYPIAVTCPYTGYGADVWVDFDQSGTFDASEYFSLSTSGTVASGSILVPTSALLGTTGLRVRNWYTPYGASGACANSTGYETEDYLIDILPAPSCIPPSALAAGNITSSTADISWTVNSSATQWQIEYGPTPFTQGTGTIITTSTNPYTLTGLTQNTEYAYFVRDICGPGDTSTWTGAISNFKTACVPFVAPYTESFNGTSTPSCWTNSAIVPNGWMFGTNYSSPGYDVSGAVDHTGTSGSTYAWVDNSYVYNTSSFTSATLTSPDIDISTLTNPQVRYYIISYNPSYVATYGNNKLVVDAYDYTLASWVTVDSVQQSLTSASWQERSVSLSAITSTITQLRFRFGGTSTSCCYNDILIDDINVEEVPTCPTPTVGTASNVTTTTADLDWVENGSATQWQVEYGQGNFSLGTGTRVTTTANPYSATVSPATTYTYFVRSICGPNDTSAWSGRSSSFLTPCIPVTSLPWTENFDALSSTGTTSFPPCWFKENGDWATSAANTYNTSFSTPNHLRCAWAATNEYMWTPGIDLVANTSYDLSFYVAGDGWTGWTVDVFENSAQTSAGANQIGTTFTAPGSGSIAIQPYTKQTYTFMPSSTGTYYFAVRVNQPSGSPWYIAFDNFTLEVTPTCPAPTAVTLSNATSSSLDVGWTSNSTATLYQIEYAQGTSFTLGTGTRVGPTGVTNPYTATGLSQGLPYTFYVREICGAGDTSSWSSPATAFTAFPATPPNDDCITPVDISNGALYYGTNAGATQTLAACDATPTATDVWYSFTTGASAGVISDSVNTSFSGGDVVVQMFSGTCGSLTPVVPTAGTTYNATSGCVDGPAAGMEWSTYNVAANTTYFIRVYAFNTTAPGPFSIRITGAPLAIKLDKISATNVGKANRIDWNTSSEDRGDKFELERSIDGKNFAKIYEQRANGEASRYTYMDNNAAKGQNYYRLRMIAANGGVTYSETVSAFVKSSGFEVEAFPNPVSRDLTVKVTGTQGADATIQVTDVTGKVIKTVKMNGSMEIISMTGLANGIYLIKYSDDSHTQTIRVNKQ